MENRDELKYSAMDIAKYAVNRQYKSNRPISNLQGGADRKLDRGAVRTGGSHVQQGEGRALPPGDGGRHGADRRREVRGGLGGRGQEVGDGAPPAQLHRGAL